MATCQSLGETMAMVRSLDLVLVVVRSWKVSVRVRWLSISWLWIWIQFNLSQILVVAYYPTYRDSMQNPRCRALGIIQAFKIWRPRSLILIFSESDWDHQTEHSRILHRLPSTVYHFQWLSPLLQAWHFAMLRVLAELRQA